MMWFFFYIHREEREEKRGWRIGEKWETRSMKCQPALRVAALLTCRIDHTISIYISSARNSLS